MQKTSEKFYNLTIVVTSDGRLSADKKVSSQFDPNQGMEGGCHKANDLFLPGSHTERKVWEDRDNRPKPPRDLQHKRVDVQETL